MNRITLQRLAFSILAALALLVSAPAVAGPPDFFLSRSADEVQVLTRAAPTLSTEGVELRNAVSVQVVLDAGANTLNGTGSVKLWLYEAWDGTTGKWAPFNGRTITDLSGCTGQSVCVVEALTVDGPRLAQRFLAATSGIGVSAGTTVTVRLRVTVSGRSVSQ